MNKALPQQKSPTRWPRGMLYGMLLLAVLVSFPLGMTVAAMGAWFAIQGGSLIYLPLGLVALLAGLVMLSSRSIADFCLLAFLAIAAIAWSLSGSHSKSGILTLGVELSGRIDVLLGLLVIMVVTLLLLMQSKVLPHSGLRTDSPARQGGEGIVVLRRATLTPQADSSRAPEGLAS